MVDSGVALAIMGILDPSFGDLYLLFSIASFRLGNLNSAETLLNWEDLGATGFQMTAPSDEVFALIGYHRIYPHIAINRLLLTDQCVTSCY
jgi:hypothetical protein